MEFTIKNKTDIGSIILNSGDVIEYDGKSHFFLIRRLDKHNNKISVPYIFGVVNDRINTKDLPEARNKCKEFLIKMNWL